MGKRVSKKLMEYARKNRRKLTYFEKHFWEMVRDRRYKGLKFRRQHVLEPYIADFYCSDLKLVIELDGPIHHSEASLLYDQRRDDFMRSNGYTVLRFSNEMLIEETERIFDEIDKCVRKAGIE
jgi:very-short-patch-repair endonuclease